MELVITFPSVYHAFRARKILEKNALSVRLASVPRSLSASCDGLAAYVDEQEFDKVLAVLEANDVSMLKKGVRL